MLKADLSRLPSHMRVSQRYGIAILLNPVIEEKLGVISRDFFDPTLVLEDPYIYARYNIGYLAHKEYWRSRRCDFYSGIDLFK